MKGREKSGLALTQRNTLKTVSHQVYLMIDEAHSKKPAAVCNQNLQ
jgi:hypothetical protein